MFQKFNILQQLQKGRLKGPAPFVLIAGLLALGLLLTVRPGETVASNYNVLANGSFEQGFSAQSCGMVGSGWHCFTNGGAANYGLYDEMWNAVVADGAHSQLIEINTYGRFEAESDRVAGIVQTARVAPHTAYTFNLKGMIRTTELSGDPWRYRVEVGFAHGSSQDPAHVLGWIDTGWDTYYDRTSPGQFSEFTTTVVPSDEHLSVFVRVRKKWGTPEMELNVNLDSISLTGQAIGGPVHLPSYPQPVYPTATPAPVIVHPGTSAPPPTSVTSCGGANLVTNGNFEHGFYRSALGDIGNGWTGYTNGGAANYGFYDDQWSLVVADGAHSQLIELNTKGIAVGDPDRVAGIYQIVTGLVPGRTYELSVAGILRGDNYGPDENAFAAQWGYHAGSNGAWSSVPNMQIADIGSIYPRTAPGGLQTYRSQFVAPSSTITLFLQGLKKWGTAQTEMDLNLDSVRMTACTTSTPVHPPVTGPCTYVVQPGDTLGRIASHYGITVHELAARNNLISWDLIHVGQVLQIPRCTASVPPTPAPPVVHLPAPVPPAHPPAHPPGMHNHTVRPGETLSGIAAYYGLNMYHLAEVNGIYNVNHIYVGQVLRIP